MSSLVSRSTFQCGRSVLDLLLIRANRLKYCRLKPERWDDRKISDATASQCGTVVAPRLAVTISFRRTKQQLTWSHSVLVLATALHRHHNFISWLHCRHDVTRVACQAPVIDVPWRCIREKSRKWRSAWRDLGHYSSCCHVLIRLRSMFRFFLVCKSHTITV